eukprot:m.104428 g.104428  ORF g.104428 m.104428 type:complete len:80 (+) comp15077_c0_seq2:62-301(+)
MMTSGLLILKINSLLGFELASNPLNRFDSEMVAEDGECVFSQLKGKDTVELWKHFDTIGRRDDAKCIFCFLNNYAALSN